MLTHSFNSLWTTAKIVFFCFYLLVTKNYLTRGMEFLLHNHTNVFPNFCRVLQILQTRIFIDMRPLLFVRVSFWDFCNIQSLFIKWNDITNIFWFFKICDTKVVAKVNCNLISGKNKCDRSRKIVLKSNSTTITLKLLINL